jgi:DNA-binding response OmpR family regulator
MAVAHAKMTGVAPTRVLVIEDSELERSMAADRLEKAGHIVSTAADGAEGMRRLYELHPDIVLLDIVLPGMDGWKLLEQIRQLTDVPVIMVTGLNSEIERIRGLRGGADDYIGKPYSAAELLARIEAVLRRTATKSALKEIWEDDVVRIDFTASEVTVRGDTVTLTPLEFRLLATLAEHAGQVLSRDQLLELVWGDPTHRTGDEVKLYIGYLRRKVEKDPAKPELIETVRGFGYRYRKLS